jgi:hypothetical protein
MFATFLTVGADRFRWRAGQDEVSTYRSSQQGLRPFCRTCGSVAPVVLPDQPDVVFVPAGNVEGDPGIRPEYHMFAASRPDWFPITDALPRHAMFPPQYRYGRVVEDPSLPRKAGAIRGHCLCGDVAFELAGAPEVVQNCHCTRCRRARSAAHATNCFFRREQLTWLAGEDDVVNFPLPGAKRFGQAFCRRCGSTIPRVVDSTGYVVVPCGSLDDAPGMLPRGHIFTGSKAPWYDIADRLPQWEALPA